MTVLRVAGAGSKEAMSMNADDADSEILQVAVLMALH